jgi:NAD(P)-dependent dehydrogenase (short-subunit alcohol dehydrogenase family)
MTMSVRRVRGISKFAEAVKSMKTAIVTGASGNLGQAVIKKLLQEGHHVLGTVIPNDPVQINISHAEFETVVLDLLNGDESEKLVQQIFTRFDRIDVAVLTVGGFAGGKIAETTSSDILKQFRLNFETAYNMARPVFAQMRKRKSGRIFMVGSRPGSDMRNSKGMVAYGIAKSLIFRLAELMNDEAKEDNVVTSVIVPSTIDTPENRKSMPDADFSKWVSPEKIASVIAFYCSDDASIIREPVIRVYGEG